MKARLNYIKSQSKEAKRRPIVAFIPGGPGLSSKTLVGLEVLTRSFDLVFIDPPGTAGLTEPEHATFDSILESMENPLKDLERPIILAGHSFGGYQAARILEKGLLNIAGLVLLATPLSKEAFGSLKTQYEKFKDSEMIRTEKEWSQNKTLNSMRDWFASYGPLFFSEKSFQRGRKLIQEDLMSAACFVGARNVDSHGDVLSVLKKSLISKISLAAEKDNLVTAASMQSDAQKSGLEFHIIKDAGHFINLDQPEAVAKLIENKFIDSTKG